MRALLAAYAAMGALARPLLAVYLRRRARRGKEDAARLAERWGFATTARPAGPLVWIHAASIGESLSVLPVIERLTAAHIAVLVTTVTRSSAELLAARLPAGAIHAFAPLDVRPALHRLVAHWRPDVTVIVEQELWPLLLALSPAPRLLINARLSAGSAARWRRLPGIARWLLGHFDRILAQSDGDAERLRALGADPVETPGNLKTAAPPLAADPPELASLEAALAGRRVWIAASTHEPEEGWIEAADRTLRAEFPTLLTIIVPRHPERAAAIQTTLARSDCRRRSEDPRPSPDVGLYIVDSFGELGLFYRIAEVAFVGGSLVPHGGQNPLEPARLARPILIGPHTANFADLTHALVESGGARRVATDALAGAVSHWLHEPATARTAGAAAAACAAALSDAVVDRTVQAIREALPCR